MDRKRKLGQVFLRNMTIVDEIIRIACPTCEDIFIEIGAGFGVLTEPLSKRVRKVYAIELDNTLVGILKERFWSRENVEIINENILKLSFLDIAKSHERKLRIIGNIPYSISSPILFKLLEHRTLFHSFLLMFQKEVADRIVARSSTKSY